MKFERHLIQKDQGIRVALMQLNELAADAILFVVDENNNLYGSLTDGDIRRGFIKGLDFSSSITEFVEPNPVFIRNNEYSIDQLETYRKKNLKIIPIVDENNCIIDVLNLRIKRSLLPFDAVIMAGGKGERLLPLTLNCPKPLLKVGDKPIIEHNIDRLIEYGVKKITISIRYLGEQLKEYFKDGSSKEVSIDYVEETKPLGTLGAVGLIDNFPSEHILLMNSDLLTNIDFSDFYKSYIESNADFMVVSIPYQVNIPYAILQVENSDVLSFAEKPTYNYFSNGGIYLFNKRLLEYIPKDAFYNVTDFMDDLIKQEKKVSHYPLLGYWLDVGKYEDYLKAQHDIKHIQL